MIDDTMLAYKFRAVKNIGVISDTHNLLRLEADKALQNSELIIHAGDIGNQQILNELKKIAPVVAVRGNSDNFEWCETLPVDLTISVGEIEIFIIHNLKDLVVENLSRKTKVIITGHSHKPLIEEKKGVIYLNPGSAGRRRFKLPTSLAKLYIEEKVVKAEIIELMV